MSKELDFAVFNSLNAGALSITFIDVESMLTILVLLSALAYNIKKIRDDKS